MNDGNNTWFFTGNSTYKNMDWHTKNGDPSYFPESGYTICGGEEAAIVGYSHLADGTLAIHKEKRGAGPTIYYRTAQMSGDGDVYFPLKDGPCGQGAISASGFANFANDAIFLSDTGVYALTTGARSLLGERFVKEGHTLLTGSYRRLPIFRKRPFACIKTGSTFRLLLMFLWRTRGRDFPRGLMNGYSGRI